MFTRGSTNHDAIQQDDVREDSALPESVELPASIRPKPNFSNFQRRNKNPMPSFKISHSRSGSCGAHLSCPGHATSTQTSQAHPLLARPTALTCHTRAILTTVTRRAQPGPPTSSFSDHVCARLVRAPSQRGTVSELQRLDSGALALNRGSA